MIYPVLTYSRTAGDFAYDLAELHKCGLKAIRLIYKGKSEEEFDLRIREIQKKIAEHKLDIDILIDLPGNKPTVGNLNGGLSVKSGVKYHLADQRSAFSFSVIPTLNFFSHNNFPNLTSGDIISIADDELNLVVNNVNETVVTCEALNSFHLTSNRSISVKSNPFHFEANSERDIHFVQNLEQTQSNVRLLVSFTKKAADIQKIKALQPGIDVIPKIESILDDAALFEIMNCCATMLLGRGDLSTSCPPNELFRFQEHVIALCKTHNKHLIIGTGLLAGIGDKQAPTISDVMDYSYLRSNGINAFLISGSNAHNRPFETLAFMREFEL